MGTDPQPRLATHDDVDGMADALAAAFHDDPVMGWLFGQEHPRPAPYLRTFLAHEGRRHLAHRTVYTVDGHPGAAYWDPPGHWKTSMLSTLRLTPLMLRGMGRRSVAALRGLARMEQAHAQHPEHYYLAVLGTRPDHQGRGVGAALMAPVLARCDADGIGAYLESSKESNVPYYRRHGFEVVGEVTFPGGPTIWPMWREAQPPSGAG
ncbi:MAG: GNAT family N-acetyltransferase [Acidimicrobiales bacterium]